jgi:hypothetical protein
MSNQGEQSYNRAGLWGLIRSLLVSLAYIVVAMALVVSAWNDTGAATNEVSMRIFLVGFAVGAVVIVAGSVLVEKLSRHGQSALVSGLSLTLQHLAIGIVIGLAIGTTDWANLRLAGWWQLWWMVPLMLAYVSLVLARRRVSNGNP